jgi:acetyl-CoA acetyltransferase
MGKTREVVVLSGVRTAIDDYRGATGTNLAVDALVTLCIGGGQRIAGMFGRV